MTLTGEGPRCQECMARLNETAPPPTVQGVVLPAGTDAARQDAAREAYYATETKLYCARHPQTETGLRCGRCDTPICPRCMVHASIGIRCPDCAANPQRTIGVQAEQAAAAARGRPAPARDTGFRNYWYKNQAYQKVQPRHYLLAILAGLGTALGAGLVWGFLMEGSIQRFLRVRLPLSEIQMTFPGTTGGTLWSSAIEASTRQSIHLIPEIALGILVAGAISRVTQNRVGPGLQLIAGLSVVLAILVSVLTVGARIYQNATGVFPAPGPLLNAAIAAFGQQFSNIGVVLFWVVGIAFAVYRLKR